MKQHFTEWWSRQGLVIGMWSVPAFPGPRAEPPHQELERPEPVSPAEEEFYSDAAARARRNHYFLSRCAFLGDLIPVADTMIGPGSLALYLGSEPEFTESTVWFGSTMEHDPDPESRPPLRFDPENRWWRIQEATLRECAALARGRYLVGCPDLIENIDILASLRGMSTLLTDMIDRPATSRRFTRSSAMDRSCRLSRQESSVGIPEPLINSSNLLAHDYPG